MLLYVHTVVSAINNSVNTVKSHNARGGVSLKIMTVLTTADRQHLSSSTLNIIISNLKG